METQEIFDNVVQIIKEHAKKSELLENPNRELDIINDLKVNSARLVDIIINSEDVFDIEIDDDDADDIKTIGDAVDVIGRKINAS